MVNGTVAALGDCADDQSDKITIDGKPLQNQLERCYIMLNKPRGYVTTMSDAHNRPTVADLTADLGVRVYPVGRLDMDSEGLLLMTNDGELTNFLTHPSNGVRKKYLVRVQGSCTEDEIRELSLPMEVDGVSVCAVCVKLLRRCDSSTLIEITISEGRNRQIRKMCANVGLMVLRLRRISEGSLELGDLPSGKWRHLTDSEIANLQNSTD